MTAQDTRRRVTARRETDPRTTGRGDTGRIRVGSSAQREGQHYRMDTLTQEREATWVNVLLLSVNIALGLFVTLRFGLLAMTVGFYFCFLLYHTPIVFDRTAWYAGASAVYTLVLVALGVFGLVIAKGSRPWLQDSALLEG